MSAITLPASCVVALKEWATVLEAMARGEQLVLIRKGGLIEPAGGFELLASTFVFYPTFEHQAVPYVREPHRRYFDEAQQRRLPAPRSAGQAGAPQQSVMLDLVGVAVSSVQSHDPAVVERLRPYHIYDDAFLAQRLKWQPQQPLVIAIVRVFRLPAPQVLTVTPAYAGCKSWVELEAPLALAGAAPVLDDATFEQRAQQLQRCLAPM